MSPNEKAPERARMEALMTELHDTFGNHEPTPQQQQLMRSLEQHVHGVGEPDIERPDLVESLEVMVEDLEAEHPRTAGVFREILGALRNMGV
jgi:hypothetical protein